jgi:acyl carrier protein
VGCIIDDERSEGGGIDISPGSWVEDGAILLGDANASAEGLMPETTRSAAGQADGSVDGGHGPTDAERRIRTVVSRVVPLATEARGDEDLSRIKGWDSLCALRILVALENEFHVSLPPDLFAAQPRIDSLAKAISASASVRNGAHV